MRYTQASLACWRAPTASKPLTGHQATVEAEHEPRSTSASNSADDVDSGLLILCHGRRLTMLLGAETGTIYC